MFLSSVCNMLVTNSLITKYLKILLGPKREKNFHTRINFCELNIETFRKTNFAICMQENQIFFQNNYAKLDINLRIFLHLKNKRLS